MTMLTLRMRRSSLEKEIFAGHTSRKGPRRQTEPVPQQPGVARGQTLGCGDPELQHHTLLHLHPSSTASPEQGSCPRSEGQAGGDRRERHAPPQDPSPSCCDPPQLWDYRLKRNRALVTLPGTQIVSSLPMTHKLQGSLEPSMSKHATRHTRREDGGLGAGGQQPALGGQGPELDGCPGGNGTRKAAVLPPRAETGVLSGPGLGADAPQDTRETRLTEERGARGNSGRNTAPPAQDGLRARARTGAAGWAHLVGWGQVGERESVGLGSAPIPQSCCAASWGLERDQHGMCGRQLSLECSESPREGTPGPPCWWPEGK